MNAPRPTCACGHRRDHLMVSPVARYSGWGSFWVFFMGVTARPVRIDFQCRVCRQTFDSTTDPDDLEDHA